MANTGRISSSSKFFLRRNSPSTFALYIVVLSGFSVFVFIYYSKDFFEIEQKQLPFEAVTAESDKSQLVFPSVAKLMRLLPSFILCVLMSVSVNEKHFSVRPEPRRFQFLCGELGESQQRVIEWSCFSNLNLATKNEHLWDQPSSHGLHPCVNPTSKYKAAQESSHYITVRSNGGLNQMRTGIADMVAVARIVNATLVIPQLDKRSFWRDSSTFADVFDVNHFIKILHEDVRIVKELPKSLESVPRARKHFTSWAGMSYYEDMKQLWNEYDVIHVAKSDSRLANNELPLDIQRLRCRALYNALRFSPSIENLGKRLVERIRAQGGQYITLHLRYEKDMLSFTGCTYGLSAAESEELRIMRENTKHWKLKDINSTEQRKAGLCPLTPKEVGILLKALGYPQTTIIYIAAGEIYGGMSRLSELTSRFPNIVFKETVATEEELRPFFNHASQNAALDYIISVESDVFVPSHSGNMARAVEGHRRFLGHRKTISPDRKGLVSVFDMLESGQMQEGTSLSNMIRKMHKKRQGSPRRRAGSPPGIKGRARFRYEESFYENPFPECICKSR